MIFDHFPRLFNEKFKLDRGFDYGPQRVHHKPRGFWVSVRGEDDWPHWIVENEFREDTLVARHEVKLRDSANLLLLSSPQDIRDFHAEYKAPLKPEWEGGLEYIDWERVVSGNSWDGIIIAPYQWLMRNDLERVWYYSWDVASGCIWNLDVIESVTPAFDVPLPVSVYADEAEA